MSATPLLPAPPYNTEGFTLVGYASSPLGLGEDLRAFASMLEHLKIPFSVLDLPTESQGTVVNPWTLQTQQPFATFVYFMSPMSCLRLAKLHPELFEKPKQKIGYFLWELPDFPQKFIPALELMDQVWCPTHFVQNSFFQQVKKLILALPLPVLSAPASGHNFRTQLGIPDSAFVSLYMFDIHSTLNRKNPQAVVQAFELFAKRCPKAHLILKINRLTNAPKGSLDWLPQHPRIHLISTSLAPNQLTDLYQASNCYLSLHRSEGFGRTLVEALQNGLYLVSTPFSGPNDFLTPDNALLVDWDRQEVQPGEYPHAEASWWANPRVSHAAEQLKAAYQMASSGHRNSAGVAMGQRFLPASLASRYEPVLQAVMAQARRPAINPSKQRSKQGPH